MQALAASCVDWKSALRLFQLLVYACRGGGGMASKVSYFQLKTCKEKCKHESIIRTYFGIECSLSRSTILISASLNAATVQRSSEISFRCLVNSSNVSFSATGGEGDARLSDQGPLCCRTRT
jgi:hypothetical protein